MYDVFMLRRKFLDCSLKTLIFDLQKSSMDEEKVVCSPVSYGKEIDTSNEYNSEDANKDDSSLIKAELVPDPNPDTVVMKPEMNDEKEHGEKQDIEEKGAEKETKEEKRDDEKGGERDAKKKTSGEKGGKKAGKVEGKKKPIKKRIRKPKTDKLVLKKRTSFFERRNIR